MSGPRVSIGGYRRDHADDQLSHRRHRLAGLPGHHGRRPPRPRPRPRRAPEGRLAAHDRRGARPVERRRRRDRRRRRRRRTCWPRCTRTPTCARPRRSGRRRPRTWSPSAGWTTSCGRCSPRPTRTGSSRAPLRVRDRVLRDFRRAGVDRSPEDRDRLRALAQRCTELGLEFSRNIRDDVRSIRVRPEQLDGLPEDFRAEHPRRRGRAGHAHHRVPRPAAGPHVRDRPRGPPRPDPRAPAHRLARQRAGPRRAAPAARRAGHPAGLPGLAHVRRRGQDDRLRQRHRGPGRAARRAHRRARRRTTWTSCSRGTARTCPAPRRSPRRTTCSTTRSSRTSSTTWTSARCASTSATRP